MKVVLTKPFSLDVESNDDYRAPNLLHRILSLFNSVRPGSDLTRFQLPPLFNFPKSHLQCYGEQVYGGGTDLLSRCSIADSPLDRFTAVLAWSISTIRPVAFGFAPYNPILGETHHVSTGSLNVLLEQARFCSIPLSYTSHFFTIKKTIISLTASKWVPNFPQVSHHPPVSALHATDEKESLEIIWSHHAIPKFHGASVETNVRGKRQLKLLSRGETYEMNAPKLLIRFLPVPGTDWVGNVRIRCQENGLEAQLCLGATSFLGLRGNSRSIKGNIYETSTMKTLAEFNGQWDRIVKLKGINNGKETVIYNAKEVLSGLKTPIVKDLGRVWPSESSVVWSELSQAILSKDWDKAREAKKDVEENQRALLREKESRGETWVPKHFTATYTRDGDWECSPIQSLVPPAPIVVPP